MLSHSDYLTRFLLEEGVIDAAALDSAVTLANEKSLSLEHALVTAGILSPNEVAIARAMLCECPFVDLTLYDIDINHARLLPRGVAEKHQAFPLFRLGDVLTVGMADPLNLRAIDQLRQLLKCEIEPVLCEPGALISLTSKAYSLVSTSVDRRQNTQVVEKDMTTGEEPIVAAVNQMMADGIDAGASDIHISPCEHDLQLRYRIDGVLQPQQGPPLAAHPGIVQRLKVMANLDLTQTRRPQDGKFRFTHHGEHLEIRLSTLPTVCGENVVMRILRPHGQILDFEDLGMEASTINRINELISRPHGMFLVTGPTGSGKTSTLYTAIKKLNTPGRNIMTIEDPVEIRMHGIRQIQAHPEIGLTFAGALRSILRQDPDIVLVGEIRDAETALIATQASLTGHLVLSTLHTNDASGAIARLRDLGVPSFVINAALLGAMAQRLVRRICRDCATPAPPDLATQKRFSIAPEDGQYSIGGGCSRCSGSGYRGRVGIYELLPVTPEIAVEIDRGATTQELSRVARQQGMRLMWQDGLDKARLGITSIEEIAKAVATMDSLDDAQEPLRLSA